MALRTVTTEKVRDARDGSFTISELDRRHQVFLDGQPMVSACAVEGCAWSFSGPTVEALAAAAAHREEAHPELARRKRRRGGKAQEIAEAQALRAERDDASRLEKVERGRARALGEAAGERLGPDAAAPPNVGPSEAFTLDTLAEGPKRLSQVALERGISQTLAGSHLASLLAKGLVVRVSRGVYARADWSPPAAVTEREPESAQGVAAASGSGQGALDRTAPLSRSATASPKAGLLRMLARDVRRVADTLDAFVDAYEAELLEALEREAA